MVTAMMIRSHNRDTAPNRLNIKILLLFCAGIVAGGANAADELDTLRGLSLWGASGDRAHFTAASGQSLLRPPASWSWNDGAAPQLDIAAGVARRFASGLSLDAGLSLSHVYEQHTAIDYRDYFMGVSYGDLDGKVWYLPESALSDEPILYYEAGWRREVTDNLSLSLRVGQAQTPGYGLANSLYEQPSLSLGASTDVGGYGLGLRLIGGGGGMFGGGQDLRLMGSISTPLR